ncbi:MAG: hypothetical protein EP299_11725 [Acidobacteria bacterium]|nr:MAG: hypothetical protein EP299_11725 [Acidobacteriota bacterium]
MENFDSWAWIIIAVFVFATRFLPRLFRRGKSGSESAPPRQPSTPKRVQEGHGTGMDFEKLAKSLPRSRPSIEHTASPPPPIEPK